MEHEFDAEHTFEEDPLREGESHAYEATSGPDLTSFDSANESDPGANPDFLQVTDAESVQVQQEDAAPAPDGGEPRADHPHHGAQLLDFIAEIERGLSQLREASIEQASVFEATEEVRQRIDGQRAEIEAQRHEIDRERANLATRECELESRWADLEQLQTSLDDRISELDRRQHDIEQIESKLGERHSEIEEQAAGIQREWEQINDSRSKLDADLHEISEEQGRLETWRNELDQRQHQLDERQAGLDRQHEELETLRHSLESQRAEIEEQRSSLEERVQALAEQESRINDLRGSTDEANQHFAEREQALVEREMEIAQQQRELEAQLQAAQSESDGKGSSDEAERQNSDAHELKHLREMLAERTGQIDALRRALEEARAEASRASQAGDHVSPTDADRAADRAADRVTQLESELHEREKAIETLTTHFKTLKTQFENARQTLLERNREIERLRGEIEQLEAEGQRSESVDAPVDTPAPVVVEGIDQAFLILRRERLRTQRRLLKERIAKLAEIKKQIEQRAASSKEMASQQDLIKSVQEDLARAEAKMIRKWAHSATVTRLFMFVMTLAILAGGCYFGVMRFVPATYQAQATVTAQARPGFPLTDEQTQTWQLVNEEMFMSDALIKSVADRFAQQRITELATPDAAREYLASNLTMRSDNPGSIEFSLIADGQNKAQRILETYSIAFVSASNSSRSKRTDGARAKLTVPATIDPIPVKDERLTYAAIAFGGSIFLLLPIGMVIYGRLKNVERVIDPDGDLFDPMVSGSKWNSIRDRADGVVMEHTIE